MNAFTRLIPVAVLLLTGMFQLTVSVAQNAPLDVNEAQALLASPDRSAADKARDSARKPAEVVAFAGLTPGMTIVDVMAASGWYTEVLALATGPDGTVYAQNPAFILEFRDGANDKALSARLADNRLPNVERVDVALADADIAVNSVDIVLTALNFHDTYYMAGENAAAALLSNIYALLKPGGALILIDHDGQPDADNAKLHRIPEQIALDMALAAGFTLEAEGDMLKHPEDDGTEMVFMKNIRGKTDRFVLKLRK
jgi:predicted methyltransferase